MVAPSIFTNGLMTFSRDWVRSLGSGWVSGTGLDWAVVKPGPGVLSLACFLLCHVFCHSMQFATISPEA